VLSRFGRGRGTNRWLAKQLGITESAISHWNGTGIKGNHGHIPQKHWDAITKLARKEGILLSNLDWHGGRQ